MMIHMKAIQFTIDEGLLRRVDGDPEARQLGRSAFLRRAIEAYLRRRRADEIRDAYRRGYGKAPARRDELGPDPETQAWPEDWRGATSGSTGSHRRTSAGRCWS